MRRETGKQREHRRARQRARNRLRSTRQTMAQDATESMVSARGETMAQREHRLARQQLINQRRRTQSCDEGESAVGRETVEQRARRIAKQLVNNRTRRENARLGPTTFSLEVVTEEVKRQIQLRLAEALGAEGLDECVCAICDRLVLRRLCTIVGLSDSEIINVMRRNLCVPHDARLPDTLIQQYDCSDVEASCKGLLLAKGGVRKTTHGTTFNVCGECRHGLKAGSKTPPMYAIANGFFIGVLPEHLRAATWIEKVMTQLVTVVAQTRVMRGGAHRAIRSHCMVFDATPGPPATLLPRRVDRENCYRVILAGPMTDQQSQHIRKLHEAQGSVVNELLVFFKANNHLYANVNIDGTSLQTIDTDPSMYERLVIRYDDEETAQAMEEEQDSVVGRSDAASVAVEDECQVVERNLLLAPEEIEPDLGFVQRVVDLNAHETSQPPRLRVEHSSHFASSVDIEAKMHAHLFPFGRGHPGESRQTHVSKRDCIRYYAMLSSRLFAQDPTFMLTAFARLSLENMYTLASVKCKRFTSIFDGYETLSQQALTTALLDNERRQRGQPRLDDVDPTVERFLKSVELGSVAVWGSSAERRQCCSDCFGYQVRFGQPSLFVTFTPNTDNSYAMAHYAGVLSVDTLFDWLEARVPTRTEMKQASMADDCAAARLFMRNVEAFIDHALGIDPKTKESRASGGLFGKVRAYFGMVETQDRGTLHIHFLIWLTGAPANTVEFEERLANDGEAFSKRLTAFADSIVTTSLPIGIDHVRCSGCNVAGVYSPLPIPSVARRRGKKKREDLETKEPLLVQCSACGQESSSQHIMRQLLIQNRPPHWPPPVRNLSHSERQERLDSEVRVRSSRSAAETVLREREQFWQGFEGDESDQTADWVARSHDAPQLGYLHPDDDPFRADSMSRLIEMTPPSKDVFRMSQAHRDYIVSNLVVNMNMHWWSHTGSCFKASRATPNASVCRYRYPRERVESSIMSGESLRLRRATAHEYINNYNPVIMASFKCNHDVQVLIGGKDATDRIYYTCKYVTKSQRQIDSSTTVGLASFQRRQVREALQAASENPPEVNDIQRRRVTGMVYTFTNKQEIAGPLAALYIFRGSCCYSSDMCVKLPLSDILNQLLATGEYGCSLVQSSTENSTIYRSATFLDDYVYRSPSIEGLSVYEFTMQCYRRLRNNTVSPNHLFQENHALSRTHCLAFRRKEGVPVIRGPRFSQIHEFMSEEEREQHAKTALVLFKPFRTIHDLLSCHESAINPWLRAYNDWESTRSKFVETIMRNMQDYYSGRAREDDVVIENEGDDGSSSSGESDDAYIDGDFARDGDEEIAPVAQDLLSLLGESQARTSEQLIPEFPTPATLPSRLGNMLDGFERHQLIRETALAVATGEPQINIENMDVEALKKWVGSLGSDNPLCASLSTDDANIAPEVIDRPTRVNEIIDECLRPDLLRWDTQAVPLHTTHIRTQRIESTTPIQVPTYSSIAAISRSFTLNELQHGAFAIIASNLLKRWRSANNAFLRTDAELESQQLRLYLGGEGGTGKSRVIQAIQELCRSWQKPDAIVIAAMTGKAASIVGGRTLASFLMSLQSSGSHFGNSRSRLPHR